MVQKVIILLGPPGSGKGTQAKRICKALHIPHISTGDLFRENMSKNTDLGKKAKGYINSGLLVPDAVVLEMLFDRISRPDCDQGYLLDGCPRTIPQAVAFDKWLRPEAKLSVINLPVSEEIVLERISGRLTCSQCGHIHNKFLSPPQEEGICDRCGGKLIQREDDRQKVVQERLRVYYNETAPLEEYYHSKRKLRTVNGEQHPDEAFQEIMDILKE